MARADRRALRPRDAATLILYRREPEGARVLMGQRHSGHVFMPDKFVFPGGRVDPADARIAPLTPLRPEVEARVARGVGSRRAQALAMAAVRETFEETGLLVGERTEPVRKTRSPSWRPFLQRGVVPSLEPLDIVARAITPPGDTRRFDARFFMVDAEHVHGDAHDELAGSGELLDLHWVRVADAPDLDLPEVTQLVIGEISKRLASADPSTVPAPFVRYTRGAFRMDSL